MVETSLALSDDQAEAWDTVSDLLGNAGVDLLGGASMPANEDPKGAVLAVLGKAGSGKTLLLAELFKSLRDAGVDIVSGDYEGKKRRERRTLAILAPTNKAASVLRNRGVPATTIHRILYTPMYDPEYEKIAEWLAGNGEKPEIEEITELALDRAFASYQVNTSIPAALAAAGLRGSDFITGWKRREDPLDIGFVDESSMLDAKQFADLQDIFPTLVLFGDPAQLPPVKAEGGKMVFDTLPDSRKLELSRVHRQTADNPILDLAHSLADPDVDFYTFEQKVAEAAARDERVVMAQRVESDLMARSPCLVWRNATRIRKKRLDLEARGLIKGAQVIYLGPGRKPGFSRLHVMGAEDPQLSAASIVKIELEGDEEPFIPFAAKMGATFLHGAAVTIHKAQGSQWDTVQVFAPDIYAASRMGRVEAGQPLWKRLAYVAITRAENKLCWVVRNRLARPTGLLRTDDLVVAPATLELTVQTE